MVLIDAGFLEGDGAVVVPDLEIAPRIEGEACSARTGGEWRQGRPGGNEKVVLQLALITVCSTRSMPG